jgi:hypothetical protein
MTLETDGSATAQPDAGTPDVATSTGAEAGSVTSAATADPFAGLDSGTLEWIGKAGIKDVGSLAAKARNAESLIGNSVRVPSDDATAEDWQKFYAKVGRPEKADGYEFKLPDGLPEDLPYDAEFANEFKAWAHETGLTPKQAQALHDKFVGKTAGMTAAQREAMTASMNERAIKATEGMEKAWKAQAGTPEYQARLQFADRAIRNLGGDALIEEMKSAGLMGADTTIYSPMLMDALSKVGEALYREDTFEGGSHGGAADNPFATGNLTQQMQVARSDPDRARRMAVAAGKKPSDFGL